MAKRTKEKMRQKNRHEKMAGKSGMGKWQEKRYRRTMAKRKTIKCARKRGMKNSGKKEA